MHSNGVCLCHPATIQRQESCRRQMRLYKPTLWLRALQMNTDRTPWLGKQLSAEHDLQIVLSMRLIFYVLEYSSDSEINSGWTNLSEDDGCGVCCG